MTNIMRLPRNCFAISRNDKDYVEISTALRSRASTPGLRNDKNKGNDDKKFYKNERLILWH